MLDLIFLLPSQSFTLPTKMQDNLNIITEFGNKISQIVKVFAELCRDYKRRQDDPKPEFDELQEELIKERKRRMELEDLIRQKAAASNQNDANLSDIKGYQQEWNRPKTAFALFLADQRNKILKEHPALSLQKVTGLASIKWKKLSKEQQQAYERKLQEMNKIADNSNHQDQNSGNDRYLVKKQHLAQGNQRIEQQNHDESEQRKDEEEKENSQENQNAATEEANNTQNDQEDKGQEGNNQESGSIGMLLNLFPSANQQRQQRQEVEITHLASEQPNPNPNTTKPHPPNNLDLPMVDHISIPPREIQPTQQE